MANFKLVYRYMLKQKGRTVRIIISILMTICFITCCGLISTSALNNDIEETIEQNGDYNFSGHYITKDIYNEAKNDKKVSKIALCYTEYVKDSYEGKNINFKIVHRDSNYYSLDSKKLIEGRLPESENEIIIDNESEETLKNDIRNNTLLIKDKIYNIVGKYESTFHNNNIDIETFFNSDNIQDDKEYEWLVKFKDNYGSNKQIENFSLKYNLSTSNVQINNNVAASLDNIKLRNIFVVTATIIFMVIVILIIYSVFNIGIMQRIEQIGLLRCIGFPKKNIYLLIIYEGFTEYLIGVPIGVLLGIFTSKLIINIINRFSIINIDFKYSGIIILFALVATFIAISISILVPARNAANISPLAALKIQGKGLEIRKSLLDKLKLRMKLCPTYIIAYENFSKNKKRSLPTILSFIVSLTVIIITNNIINIAINNIKFNSYSRFDYNITFNNKKATGWKKENIQELYSINGVNTVYPTNICNQKILYKCLKSSEGERKCAISFGEDYDTVQSTVIGVNDFFNEDIYNKSINLRSNEILVLKNNYDIQKGDIMQFCNTKVQDGNVNTDISEFTIVGIVDDLPFGNALQSLNPIFITNDKNFSEMYGVNSYNNIYIKVNKDIFNINDIYSKFGKINITSNDEIINKMEETSSLFTIIESIIVIMASLFGIINLVNILGANLLVRSKEFGILRAIGITKSKIESILEIEGAIYGIVGSLAGLFIGLICSVIFSVIKYRISGMWSFGFPYKSVIIIIFINILISIVAMKQLFKKYKDMIIVHLIKEIE